MQIKDRSTPVVILGAVNHGALGMARSMGALGIPVYVVERRMTSPVKWSRYCTGKVRWDFNPEMPDASVERLLRLGREIGRRSILLPTTDAGALFVASHQELLRECFMFPGQKSETAHKLADKYQMSRLAEQLGIPTARSVVPECRAEVLRFAETAVFPAVVKLMAPIRGMRGTSIARNGRELLSLYDTARLKGGAGARLLLQEYIPGGEDTVWMFNGYFDANSDCLFGMTGQKLRQTPAYTGASCLAVCAHNQTVYDTTLKFMKSVGYRGILDIGYRYDARDGTYKVLDVNPRIGATFRLFVASNGMDVLRAMYLDLGGEAVPPSPAQEGRKWIVEDCDLVSSIRYARDGNLTLGEWFRSLKGIQESALFSWRDPLPALAVGLTDAALLGSRIWRALWARLASCFARQDAQPGLPAGGIGNEAQ